jgi:hypothetical protein
MSEYRIFNFHPIPKNLLLKIFILFEQKLWTACFPKIFWSEVNGFSINVDADS